MIATDILCCHRDLRSVLCAGLGCDAQLLAKVMNSIRQLCSVGCVVSKQLCLLASRNNKSGDLHTSAVSCWQSSDLITSSLWVWWGYFGSGIYCVWRRESRPANHRLITIFFGSRGRQGGQDDRAENTATNRPESSSFASCSDYNLPTARFEGANS